MQKKVYRICPTVRAEDISGYGSKMVGGRFNSKGRAVVYTSSSISLSIVEVLAHYSIETSPKDLSLVTISFPEDSIKIKSAEDLDSSWKDTPVSTYAKSIGDAWIDSLESLVLAVPSVVNPYEVNYIINPNHPRFNEVTIEKVEDWFFDDRLIK
ncbi:RES family NAD+ phosphorylase [Marinifilum caeruleilacunae]|uniref:RES domain-containing protein n=1 Tax=Marinifilum caeruleilacunae TaxID=2499076 RepID=A0ABX1WS58_9BACT|nr:RES family NAD+ phosphorylase [Marinifilum caeruleilacunae]NOU58881.1 RES domain-containing protein [Marinifilum caeruleilacunae]